MNVLKDLNIRHSTAAKFSYSINQAYNTSAVLSDHDNMPYRDNDGENEVYIDSCEKGKYSVFEIADWFLSKSDMTHKKLQKLCYYAQAWCYALRGYRLEDTDFQAWVHGPVSPALWERFKSFGYDVIHIDRKKNFDIDKDDVKLLDDVWDTYGDNTGNALEVLTHRELPWIEARNGYAPGERCTVVISPESMALFYNSIYNGE